MSGYLRRLGAQALHAAPGMRSLALPPPDGTGVAHPDALSEGALPDANGGAAVFSSPTPHEPAAMRLRPPHATPGFADPAGPDDHAAGAAANLDAPVSMRAPASAATPASAAVAFAAPASAAAALLVPAVPGQGAARESPDRVEARLDFSVAPDTEMISSAERAGAPTPGTGVRPARQQSRNSPVTTPDAIAAPERESAQPPVRFDATRPIDALASVVVARESPARQRPAALREMDTHAAGAAETPDVHIHIGRIELTAIAAPATPRRAPPASAKAPMSLDEYLRRRNGRERRE
jgi:hypothetical protein